MEKKIEILTLTLKKKWFDLIASGVKKEEYREMKHYWACRLGKIDGSYFRKYDQVEFKNGYGANVPTMLVECNGITIKEAKPEWSDNAQGKFFVISLG